MPLWKRIYKMQLGNLFRKIQSKQSRLGDHPTHITLKKKKNTALQEWNSGLPVQDGRIEGRALISSCKSTKITTCYRVTIDRRVLGPTKKKTRHLQTKKLQQDGKRGTITVKSNPIPTRLVTHSNTKEVLPLLWRFWTPHQASQPGIWQRDWESLGIWPWRPAGFHCKTSTGLGQTETPVLGGHKQNLRGKEQAFLCTKPQRKGAFLSVSPGDWTKPPARAGSPVAARVGRGSPQGWRNWQQQSGKVPLGRKPLGGPINLTADSRAGSPQAKKLSGREHNLTQHQVTGSKLHWARPCPPEKDPVFPTTSLSHLN